MVAERRGVPGNGIPGARDEGRAARAEKQGALPAVSCVEREHVRMRGFFRFDRSGDARVAAEALFIVVAGRAPIGEARCKGVGVVRVEDFELEKRRGIG